MPTKDLSNATGKLIFLLSLIITPIFFIFVIGSNPGPIDIERLEAQAKFPKGESLDRFVIWAGGSKELTDLGSGLYQVNCQNCHTVSGAGVDAVRQKFLSGGAEGGLPLLDTYWLIANPRGLASVPEHRFDRFSFEAKWALTHYLKGNYIDGKVPSEKVSPGDVKQFMKSGMY
ncbi:MAG: hypothetical protein COT74_11370 [Bdellovibrionales bacterium CG10_big_fil_rev_8_21_14_0_10_45_34]|nr:MAG: hypothetical protein COT74_11370 [Bdellovibrionales bacterium CG10_big_fil_rev_8_21_14_0_10_45_34]